MPENFGAPRGTQDFVPPESGRWNELEARIHLLAARFGYGEIRTPVFESTELFVRGVGAQTDIVEKEMYTFDDRSGRSLTLRPEWTAPVVRAALEHHLFAQGPLRLYYIGPIFRYERPQKGPLPPVAPVRRRVLWVCGSGSGFGSDLARVGAGARIRDRRRGAQPEHDRRRATAAPRYRDALVAHFAPHLAQMSEESRLRIERNPLRLLDSKHPADVPYVASAPAFESFLCAPCREHFDALKSYLDLAGIPFTINPRIVRGLDYYGRTVFEITSSVLGAAKQRLRRRPLRWFGSIAWRPRRAGGRFCPRAWSAFS